MTVYLLNGTKREHPSCNGRAYNGVLYVTRPGYHYSDEVAAYPLTSIERWEP